MSKNKSKAKLSDIKGVLRYLKPYTLMIVLSVIFAAATVVLTLYVPILVGDAIDCIVEAGKVDFAAVMPILTKTGIIILATALLQWLMSTVNNRITFDVVRDMRKAAFAKLQILPLAYIDSKPSGEIVSRVIADVDTFADGLLLGFTQLFTGVMTILGTLVFMFRLNALIALAVVVITPLSLFVASFISKRTYSMFTAQSEVRGEQTALIDEAVGGQKLVKAFSHQPEILSQFDEINGRLEKCSLKATFFSSLVNPATRFVNSLVYAAVGCFGALSVTGIIGVGGTMTVGMLSSFLSYANQYTKPFNEISGVVTELQNAIACAGRIFEFIDEPAEKPDDPDAVTLERASGKVDIERVRFSYVPERELIEDFNLSVKPGQRIAIVGPTGCGKTTMINLLMRFYDVKDGSIKVDGEDIRHITRHSLRHNYGMVLQETWLKTGTVRENLTMGDPDASEEKMIEAAKAAHCHSFIKRLPRGYDTVIGEGGAELSQGQRQLLCIARVMLCLPPMLILDEATSSIDTRTEMKIQSAFGKMMQGRTSFIVAHRLSTVRSADVIIVMKDGHIIETGNHEELLEKGGFYARLYNSQFEG